MADDRKVRELRPGQQPQPPKDPIERFTELISKALATSDQIVVLCAKGGYTFDVFALRDDRQRILGVLSEAYQDYMDMTRPGNQDEYPFDRP